MRSGHDFIRTTGGLPSGCPSKARLGRNQGVRRLLDWVDDYEHGTSGGSEAEFVAEGHELARLLGGEPGWQVAYSELRLRVTAVKRPLAGRPPRRQPQRDYRS